MMVVNWAEKTVVLMALPMVDLKVCGMAEKKVATSVEELVASMAVLMVLLRAVLMAAKMVAKWVAQLAALTVV